MRRKCVQRRIAQQEATATPSSRGARGGIASSRRAPDTRRRTRPRCRSGRDARARARAAQLGSVTVANGGVVFVPALDGGEGMSTPSPCWWPPALPPTTPCPSGRRPGALNSTVPGLVALSDVARPLRVVTPRPPLARPGLPRRDPALRVPGRRRVREPVRPGLGRHAGRQRHPDHRQQERRPPRLLERGAARPVARPPGWWCSSIGAAARGRRSSPTPPRPTSPATFYALHRAAASLTPAGGRADPPEHLEHRRRAGDAGGARTGPGWPTRVVRLGTGGFASRDPAGSVDGR